jgi:hypothetical protein
MVTFQIIAGILIILVIGFTKAYGRYSRTKRRIKFSHEYREKFIELANKYFKTYERFRESGNLDQQLYIWLTLNVSKIQNQLGGFGRLSIQPPFQNYIIHDYQVIANTLPKFKEGIVESQEANMVDDCLLRYIGHLNGNNQENLSSLKNPVIWFREGFKEILSVPISILNWFGILSKRTVDNIKESLIFKVISGLIALITILSGLVTIIVGYDQTMEFITRHLRK